MAPEKIRFSAIGLNHGHIYGQVEALQEGGGKLVSFYAKEPDLVAAFKRRYPDALQAESMAQILEDKSIHLIASAAIPSERADIGIAAMKHGKDYMSDKPAFTTARQLEEARRVQAETKRIFSIFFGERLGNKATVKAGEMVKAGAIGQVVQTVGLGPHQTNLKSRPAWFFEKDKYGGILVDIGSHQIDQFLFFTDSKSAEVAASQVGNFHHPDHLGLEDFGDMMLRSDHATGYIRVDWFTPGGLGTWGDGRLILLGTDGYIELRKNIDISGREGGNHLFLVDSKSSRYLDCDDVPLPYGGQLVNDVLNRTETALPQSHTFLASELSLIAESRAKRLGNLK